MSVFDRRGRSKRLTSWLAGLAISVAAMLALAVQPGAAGAEPPPLDVPFEITSFTTSVTDGDGDDLTQAGAHPAKANAKFSLSEYFDSEQGRPFPIEEMKSVITDLPPGFVGNPTSAAKCPLSLLPTNLGLPPKCPAESAVGTITIVGGIFMDRAAVYNLVPERGYPAEFGFSIMGFTYYLYPELRSDGDYGLRIVVDGAPYNQHRSVDMTFCGNGAENIGELWAPAWECKDADPGAPQFLTNPASECTNVAPVTRLAIDSWTNPGRWTRAEFASPLITGCENLTFEPTVNIAPTTSARDAATGLDVEMTFPQEDNAEGLAPPALKKAVVTLPEGMAVNPAVASGLAACADGELRLKSKDPMACPQASKIGSAVVTSPLLDDAVGGDLFIRSQNSDDPESGEMFRLALVLQHPDRGIDVRLPGQIRVDGRTGQVKATFDNNPELPVSKIDLKIKGGSRAPLSTPAKCGRHTIETELTSWGRQTVKRLSHFDVNCAGPAGFSPSFEAGTVNPRGGESSSFALRVARPEGDEEVKSIQRIRLPEGLLGRVASVELCGEAEAAAGACPEASRLGRVEVAAGAGSNPLWVPQAGKEPTGVYLTGPYAGAPYGLSIKVPAQAGPFDLGRVVVRSALHVDDRTAQITTGVEESRLIGVDGAVSQVLAGDLPRILKGVVLNQREIRVIVDREGFMVNPTDCSQQQITAEIQGYGGSSVEASDRFRAANCAQLGFLPRFGAKILDKGRRSTLRSWHPRTQFTVAPRAGDANIGGARVALPSSTILDQGNIGTTCTRAQMAARSCPAASIVGHARAWSPLLRRAVEGPVYLAANGGVRPLPDLAAVLDGEIRVVLQGEISTLRTAGKARLQNTFRVVPDAPVKRFVLTMRGGKKKGLLVNSTDLCRTSERGVAVFTGQNGRRHKLRPRIATTFKGCGKVRRQAARRKR